MVELICAIAIFIRRLAKFTGEALEAEERIAALAQGGRVVLSLDPPFAGVIFSACQGAVVKKNQ
jgi:hypothetical protein